MACGLTTSPFYTDLKPSVMPSCFCKQESQRDCNFHVESSLAAEQLKIMLTVFSCLANSSFIMYE